MVPKTAFLQLSPDMSITDAPVDGDPATMRIRFSQVRLTGHDFDIGTGGFTSLTIPSVHLRPKLKKPKTVTVVECSNSN